MNHIPLGSKKYSKLCSYILQEDNLYPGFTVYESMLLASNLKIADISHEEKNIIVSILIDLVCLCLCCSTVYWHCNYELSISLKLQANQNRL